MEILNGSMASNLCQHGKTDVKPMMMMSTSNLPVNVKQIRAEVSCDADVHFLG